MSKKRTLISFDWALKHLLREKARGMNELGMVFDDATGIREKVTVKSEQFATAPVYNLNGQRMSKPGKGLNIINGRKVIVY